MPLNIIRNDISKVSVDAIVNTANPQVAVGAGVDQTIYEAAGPREHLAERAKIGPMSPGQAAATPAFALDAKYIIHTVGPAWEGGGCGECEAVASCYRESLKLADELCCESVAFPLISTGTYGLPKDETLKIAVSEISSFLFTHDMTVYMVVYDRESFVTSGKAFADIRSYIEERDVRLPAGGSGPVSAASAAPEFAAAKAGRTSRTTRSGLRCCLTTCMKSFITVCPFRGCSPLPKRITMSEAARRCWMPSAGRSTTSPCAISMQRQKMSLRRRSLSSPPTAWKIPA